MIRELPDYIHDIRAAWEIVEKMNFSVIQITSTEWQAGRLEAEYGPDDGEIHYVDGHFSPDTGATAETAPIAICLAFLKVP
jgi:hypothetical protein